MAMKNCKECGNQISSKAESCPSCGAKIKKTSRLFIIILVCIGYWIVDKTILTPRHNENLANIAAAPPTPVPTPSPEEEARSGLNFDFKWRTGGLGNILIADFKVKNSSKYTVKDIVIKCHLYGNSGTRLGSAEKTVYEILKPGQGFNLTNTNMGAIDRQAKSASCKILYFEM